MTHIVFALDKSEYDCFRAGSRIAVYYDSDAVLQTVETRLKLHFQEWFLDLSQGLPYFTEMLVHNPNYPEIEARLVQVITNTDGVSRLLSIALTAELNDRNLGVDFSYIDVYNKAVQGSISI